MLLLTGTNLGRGLAHWAQKKKNLVGKNFKKKKNCAPFGPPFSKMTWAPLSQPTSPCNSKKKCKKKKQNKTKTKPSKRNQTEQSNKRKQRKKEKKRERPITDPVTLLLKPPHAREIHCRSVSVSIVGVAYPNGKRPHQCYHYRHVRPIPGSYSWSNDED